MRKCLIFFICISFLLILSSCKNDSQITLHITVPINENIQNIDTNYYKLWLEEKTGYKLVFNEIPEMYSSDYLENIVLNKNLETDIIFFNSNKNETFLLDDVKTFEFEEQFLSLDKYITSETNLYKIFDEYSDEKWREYLTFDENLYFVPSINPSRSAQNGQSLWINSDWLKKLNMTIPTTTDELKDVLYAFKTQDPNDNNIEDEVPIAGSIESDDMKSYNILINSFIYFNPDNIGFYLEEEVLKFSPSADNWREAMIYLNDLYKNELIHPVNFVLEDRGLGELATDPNDILGAFSASHLSDVFDKGDSNIFSDFIHISPLVGKEQNAVEKIVVPSISASIIADTEYPDEAFNLLDLMLSEEAFLISLYGEQGVDWEYANKTDVDIFGEVAKIVTINNLDGFMQNKNLNGLGTLFYYPEYVDGVRYSDFDIRYFNARALLSNEPYFRDENIGLLLHSLAKNNTGFKDELEELSNYIESNIIDFTKGNLDPLSDEDWDTYVRGFERFEDLFYQLGMRN